MTPEERELIRAAAREAAKDAPPLTPELIEMLRRDNCPIFNRRRSDEETVTPPPS